MEVVVTLFAVWFAIHMSHAVYHSDMVKPAKWFCSLSGHVVLYACAQGLYFAAHQIHAVAACSRFGWVEVLPGLGGGLLGTFCFVLLVEGYNSFRAID
jgi:hypothetical protein